MERKKYTSQAEKQMLALETFSSDSFLAINKRLLSFFGPSVTIFLCNLIDKYKYFKERGYLNEDGSFFLRHADQVEHTGMNEYELRKCKKSLMEYGIISTEIRGIPRKEYYYIHMDILVQEFLRTIPLKFKGQAPQNLKDNTSRNSRTIKETEYKEKESLSDPAGSDDEIEKNDTSSNGTSKPSTQERNKEYVPLASKLADVVQSSKNVKVNQTKIKSWSNEIRKIVESDGVNPERIEGALDWYQENIGGEYTPVIESGASLRDKFIRLEEAIKRGNGKPKSKPSPRKDPKEIFQKEKVSKQFIQQCYEPAKQLLTNTANGELPELAENLIDLRGYIKIQQDKYRDRFEQRKQSNIFLPPNRLIEYYIDWINDNHWIDDREPRLFTPKHKLFQKFLQYQRKLQNDRHPLTGE